jgi:hypothetical protein
LLSACGDWLVVIVTSDRPLRAASWRWPPPKGRLLNTGRAVEATRECPEASEQPMFGGIASGGGGL